MCRDIDTNEVHIFKDKETFREFSKDVDLWVGHNIIAYDWLWLSKLWGITLQGDKIRDTLILSQLLKQGVDGGHSLEAWGERLGCLKRGTTISDFSILSDELLDRCISDTEVNAKLYKFLDGKLNRTEFTEAIDVEHRMAFICLGMHLDGFKYNKSDADKLLAELTEDLRDIDVEIEKSFKPTTKLVREITPRVTKHGTLNRSDFRWYKGSDYSIFGGGPFTLFEYETFNPNSNKQLVAILDDAGWKPINKTKTGQGYKIDEVNISTLPDDAPESAKLLVKRLLLVARIRTLKSWQENTRYHLTLNNIENTITLIENALEKKTKSTIVQTNAESVTENLSDAMVSQLKSLKTLLQSKMASVPYAKKQEQSSAKIIVIKQAELEAFSALDVTSILNGSCRIHGTFNSIGTYTHRMSHRNPNLGNIAAEKSIKYKGTELKKLATDLGGKMRRLWIAEDDAWLVGTDMEGAHLRILGHLMDDKEYIQSLLTGDKKLGTDIHSRNKQALGPVCPDRDLAKTFIFTFLNGGGVGKVCEIFGCSRVEGARALDQFISSYPGLSLLRNEIFPRWAKQRFFPGCDGRLVFCDSEHHMMATVLQNYEAVLMKHANVLWRQELKKLGIRFKQVNFVHDEFQTEVYGDESSAKHVGLVQSESIRMVGERFGIKCPLAGEYSVGKNWLETH